MLGSDGSGRMPFEASAATLPGVSAPSSVVRSITRIASSSAKTLESRLIERVAGHDHRGRLYSGDLLRVVEVALHHVPDLAKKARKILGPRRDARIELIHRRLLHELGRLRTDLLLLREHLGIDGTALEVCRDDDELPDELWVTDRDEGGNTATERVAHHVRPVQLQVFDERGDVVGHELRLERSIDVGRTAVALQIDGDDLPTLRERRQVGTKHRARAQSAVQQDERITRSLDLVVELDAVHVGVVANTPGLASPFALRFALRLVLASGDSPRTAHGLPPVVLGLALTSVG